jgi:hypothetical protein
LWPLVTTDGLVLSRKYLLHDVWLPMPGSVGPGHMPLHQCIHASSDPAAMSRPPIDAVRYFIGQHGFSRHWRYRLNASGGFATVASIPSAMVSVRPRATAIYASPEHQHSTRPASHRMLSLLNIVQRCSGQWMECVVRYVWVPGA